ncbi:MAG: sigma-54-dependent Fis family transcriptional regulator [Candidatus Krumholzibacteria bacterium]|nr:sigma-54-dependent Fis family transcriptional regulator [Candidatus Krumholzibacteria bacterium]
MPDASVRPGGSLDMQKDSSPVFITSDPAMGELLDEIRRISPFPVPILITGESGVGKEVIASLIHRWSGRGSEPFIPVNASTLRGDLLESALFGHAKGSFTGAVSRHAGLTAAADRGTLFLDEIGETDTGAQARLLRFLDSGEYLPVGESVARRSNARVIAATNRDLREEIERGTFREDLYYRLSAVVFRIPPLRERRADILPLAFHFISRLVSKYKTGPFKISPRAQRVMESYDWPGNVRQLQNEITAAVLRKGSGRLEITDLPAELMSGFLDPVPDKPAGLDGRLRRFERDEILGALRRAGSNHSRAASILGLKRTTLLYRMRRHGIALREKKDSR